MKKLLTSLLTTATIAACLVPAAVHATGTTTGGDTVDTTEPTVPTECIVYLGQLVGPARVTHSPAPAGEVIIDIPDCEDIEGLCVEVVFPDFGPSRSPHGVRSIPIEPCVPAGPACDIVIENVPGGPARAAHQPSAVAPSNVVPYDVIDIPQACQDVLSGAAIPTTGSDSTNIILLGVTLVGLGAALLTTRRVATVRSR